MPIDSIPVPADGLDAAAWAGFITATVFVLALRWALDFTAFERVPDADDRPEPGLTAEQAEQIRSRL